MMRWQQTIALYTLLEHMDPFDYSKLAHYYPRMKHGCAEAVAYFAQALAVRVVAEVPDFNAADWGVVSPGTVSLAGGATLIAQQLANCLDMAFIPSSRCDQVAQIYSAMVTTQQRQEAIDGHFYFPSDVVLPRKVLFFDDSVVSGAHVRAYQKLLSGYAQVETFTVACIVRIQAHDCSVEERLNRLGLGGKDYYGALLSILQDPETIMVLRNVKAVLKISCQVQLRRLVQALPYTCLKELVQYAESEGLAYKPEYQASYRTLRDAFSCAM